MEWDKANEFWVSPNCELGFGLFLRKQGLGLEMQFLEAIENWAWTRIGVQFASAPNIFVALF